jgi:hypothetical protein
MHHRLPIIINRQHKGNANNSNYKENTNAAEQKTQSKTNTTEQNQEAEQRKSIWESLFSVT